MKKCGNAAGCEGDEAAVAAKLEFWADWGEAPSVWISGPDGSTTMTV